MYRIGHGVDYHRFKENRDLILGGVKIPYIKGLLGHSDADILTHTIMDALLGALALGSIGDHFPDTDPTFKDANSMELLDHVHLLITQKRYHIINIDSVIIAQKPKLQTHIKAIQQCLAKRLKLELTQVSIKATTTEEMGPEGRLEGMSCQASVLLKQS